jgi:hypothetical protein
VLSNGFLRGFSKTAGLGGLAMKAVGGPIGLGFTALQAGQDFKQGANKMKAAAKRPMMYPQA